MRQAILLIALFSGSQLLAQIPGEGPIEDTGRFVLDSLNTDSLTLDLSQRLDFDREIQARYWNGTTWRRLRSVGIDSFHRLYSDPELADPLPSPYFFNDSMAQHFRSKVPITRFTYLSSQFFGINNTEHMVGVFHAQSPSPEWDISFAMDRMAYTGRFNHQYKERTSARLMLGYQDSAQQGFGTDVLALYNRAQHSENWGTRIDTFFGEERFNRRTEVPINSTTAKSEWRHRDLQLRPYYFINDSATADGIKLFTHLGYSHSGWLYKDEGFDSSFYREVNLSYDSSRDRRYTEMYTGGIGLSSTSDSLGKGTITGYHAGVFLSSGNQFTTGTRTPLIDQYLKGGLSLWNSVALSTEYHFLGYYSGDYTLEASYSKNWSLPEDKSQQVHSIQAKLRNSHKTLDPYWSKFHSNHHVWDTSRIKQSSNALAGTYSYKNWAGISLSLFDVTGHMWVDSTGTARQFEEAISGYRGSLFAKASLGPFHLGASFTYRQNSKEELMPVPKYSMQGDLYYRSPLFAQRLDLKAGLTARLESEYEVPRWLPSLGTYAVQTGASLDRYPIVDLYASFKVGDVLAFLQVNHLNQNLFGNTGYFSFPDMPGIDRTFKLGIRWEFWI